MIVAGTWNDEGGRPSGYMTKLAERLEEHFLSSLEYHNGGHWDDLPDLIENYDDDLLFWFPDIPNSKEKLVGNIKKLYPKTILVTSKNNIDGKYTFMQLAAHALKNKANLFVEFTKNPDGMIEASVYDPLGNAYCIKETDVDKVAEALYKRICFLWRMTRIGSKQIGESIRIPHDITLFTRIIQEYADVFHDLIHGANPSRFMGNCSFRCTKGGFPSFRSGELIFVSKRNIDKRQLGPNGFVAVEPITLRDYLHGDVQVRYYGNEKPSVDTPIQLALYAIYPHITHMIHSHVYIDGAKMTNSVIPCGAMEEVKEIMDLEPASTVKKWMVNLKGHGSIVAMDEAAYMRGLPYVARKFPEIQCDHM